jgi:D-tyrosyl-tRNA(Tyr) deacylase
MRALLQRVKYSRVEVDGREVSRIGPGLLLLLGVAADDEEKDLEWLADKVINLRIFDDAEGRLNLSLKEAGGEIMVVSQFTLFADARKGRRPGFTQAALPDKGESYYLLFLARLRARGLEPAMGVFGAHMQVELVNDGPVTLMLDSRQ